MTTVKIRLSIADDHPAVLAGIKHELSTVPTVEVVGTARNSTEIVELLSERPCDILITDYAMPGGKFGDGMALVSFLRRRYPDLKIIIFTTIDNAAMTLELSKAGVRAILNKVDDIIHLVSAIHAVYAGATYFSPAMQTQKAPGSSPNGMAGRLSQRETEVVRLYVSGMSINAIAQQLSRSKQTVSSQKVNAMRKLGITNDIDLFRFAVEKGLTVAPQIHPTIQLVQR